MKPILPSFSQTLGETFRLYKLSALPVIFVTIAAGIIGFVFAVMLVLLMLITSKTLLSLGIFGGMVLFLLGLLAFIIFIVINTLGTLTSILIINTKDRKAATNIWAIVKNQVKNIFPYLVISVLSGLIVFTGILMLIIPGIVFSFWFSLATYVLIFENQKGVKALISSRDLVRGKVFLYIIAFPIILNIIQWLIGYILQQIKIGYLSILINILILPLYTIYFYVIYKYLNCNRTGMPKITNGRVNKYKLMATIPLILVVAVIFITIYTLGADFTADLLSFL